VPQSSCTANYLYAICSSPNNLLASPHDFGTKTKYYIEIKLDFCHLNSQGLLECKTLNGVAGGFRIGTTSSQFLHF
jgi:hypothetical protein